MVWGGVNQNIVNIPDSWGNVKLLLDSTLDVELLIHDVESLLADKSTIWEIIAPDNSLESSNFGEFDLIYDLSGSCVIQNSSVFTSHDNLAKGAWVDHVNSRKIGESSQTARRLEDRNFLWGWQDSHLLLVNEDCRKAVSEGAIHRVFGF